MAVGGIIFFFIALYIYFIPAIVGRKHDEAIAIAVLNLLLGWTLVGWVLALVWAGTSSPKHVVMDAGTPGGYEQARQAIGIRHDA
jgi:hypothetical protein